MPFGFHPFYLIILLVVVLIIFGPGKLPDLGSTLGRGIREFKRESDKVVSDVKTSASDTEPTTSASSVTEVAKAKPERES
jgi:sec-independent protein translocase protein TatA